MTYLSILKNLQADALSLADLQAMTHVSLPTLRKSVQELAASRWIRVVGQSEANGGRPAMLFGLDTSYFALLGVHLQLPGMRMILTDLNGDVLDEQEAHAQTQPTPDEALQTIINYAQDVRSRFPERKILGAGIASPGFTHPETGEIIRVGRVAGWDNFPICQRLGAALDVPVQIANDVDCMAFAEFRATKRSFADNLAYIGFDEGVKISMFLNGELYKGFFGNAGLISSRLLKVPDGAPTAEEQSRVMTLSGINWLFEQKVTALPPSEQADYQSLLAANYRQRPQLILARAGDGLPVCREIVLTLKQVLATAIANVIHTIQPDLIVVGGLLSALPAPLFAGLEAAIRDLLPALFANHARIEQSRTYTRNSAAQGANYHFMENYLLREPFNPAIP